MLDKSLSMEWHEGASLSSKAPASTVAVASPAEAVAEPKPVHEVGYISDEDEEEDKERSWKR